MLEQKKENQKAALYAFGGLEEKELNTLYNLATIKTLQKDEALFLEGDTDQTVYVVLGGEIRIVKDLYGQAEIMSTVREGAWVGEIGFTSQVPRTASALANKLSKVIAIDKTTVDALEEKTQVVVVKRLNVLASLHIGEPFLQHVPKKRLTIAVLK
jgi:CRP-like cAMP-binding protein